MWVAHIDMKSKQTEEIPVHNLIFAVWQCEKRWKISSKIQNRIKFEIHKHFANFVRSEIYFYSSV